MEAEQGQSKLRKLLSYAVKNGASDLHLTVGSPPALRLDGEMRFLQTDPLQPEDTLEFAREMMTEHQMEVFLEKGDADLAYGIAGLGRFRVNVLRQRGSTGLVMRHVKGTILDFDTLNLPPVMSKIADMPRGLVLITGTTGSGKSTTLASIIDWINARKRMHIITLEDPIEYLHTNKKSIVTQREVTIDTRDFYVALRAAMREDPDVILIGEMRDGETFQAAISAAETGHLVFSTLHTTNVMQTIDRIIDLFPSTQHDQIRSQLSLNLRGILCMRLLPRADGVGRVPACEALVVNPAARKLIKENRILQLDTIIASGKEEGMLSFNDSLHDLIKSELIKLETGLEVSDNPEDLNMLLQGIRLSSRRGGILR